MTTIYVDNPRPLLERLYAVYAPGVEYGAWCWEGDE